LGARSGNADNGVFPHLRGIVVVTALLRIDESGRDTSILMDEVFRFCTNGAGATSGRGYEVDYDTRSPFYDYAYCEFSWSIVNGVITLLYDDSMWYPVYISNYSLYRDYFQGYIDDGTRRDIRFRLKNVRFQYWDTYQGYYDGYYYDDYYYSRTRSADSIAVANDSLPVVNSGKSILSGAFAKAGKN